jgi:GTPase SAR1 family protein
MKPSQKAINVKLICVGDGNVGKTDILLRYIIFLSMLCGREKF